MIDERLYVFFAFFDRVLYHDGDFVADYCVYPEVKAFLSRPYFSICLISFKHCKVIISAGLNCFSLIFLDSVDSEFSISHTSVRLETSHSTLFQQIRVRQGVSISVY